MVVREAEQWSGTLPPEASGKWDVSEDAFVSDV